MIPPNLLMHTATVERFLGVTGAKDKYAAPTDLPCYAEQKRRLVRSATGEEVISETTAWFNPFDEGFDIPPGSKVTLWGATAKVITRARRDTGGFTVLDHVEVTLT